MLQLLLAAAACSGADVVDILAKMREKLTGLDIEAWGDRRDEPPRRYTGLRLLFRARGDSLDEAKVRRAIDLSLEKYCSVDALARARHPGELRTRSRLSFRKHERPGGFRRGAHHLHTTGASGGA